MKTLHLLIIVLSLISTTSYSHDKPCGFDGSDGSGNIPNPISTVSKLNYVYDEQRHRNYSGRLMDSVNNKQKNKKKKTASDALVSDGSVYDLVEKEVIVSLSNDSFHLSPQRATSSYCSKNLIYSTMFSGLMLSIGNFGYELYQSEGLQYSTFSDRLFYYDYYRLFPFYCSGMAVGAAAHLFSRSLPETIDTAESLKKNWLGFTCDRRKEVKSSLLGSLPWRVHGELEMIYTNDVGDIESVYSGRYINRRISCFNCWT
jgi:hypothetical protein